jgi:hypothetical protein
LKPFFSGLELSGSEAMSKPISKKIMTSTLLFLCLHFTAASFQAQEAYKIDETTYLRCDLSEVPQITDPPMPIFKALAENQEAQVAIIVYGMEGYARRHAKNVRRWLSEVRGVNPQRLVTLFGGSSDQPRLEIWLVPRGASLPKVNPVVDDKNATQFDSYAYWEGESCANGRIPALDEFAEVLKGRLDWQGYIVIRPHRNKRGISAGDADWDSDGYVTRQQARRRIAKDKSYLIRKTGLSPKQLKAVVGAADDEWTHAELWLVPRGVEFSAAQAQSLIKGR